MRSRHKERGASLCGAPRVASIAVPKKHVDPWLMTPDARRSKRKRIRRKLAAGKASAEEREWYLYSDPNRQPAAPRHALPPQQDVEGDPPTSDTPADTAPPPPPPSGVAADAGDRRPPPQDDTWHASYSDAKAASDTDDTDTGDTSATGGATDTPQDDTLSQDELKATAKALGAGVAMWVSYCHTVCAALGHPWPVPPWPHPTERDDQGQPVLLPPEQVVGALAGFAGDSAERVALKYKIRIPLQDEIVAGIAITVPALTLRAAMKNPQAVAQPGQADGDEPAAEPQPRPDASASSTSPAATPQASAF